MTKVGKITLGFLAVAASSLIAAKIVIAVKTKGAEERFTPDVEKNELLSLLMIKLELPDTPENRRPYENMTVDELKQLVGVGEYLQKESEEEIITEEADYGLISY